MRELTRERERKRRRKEARRERRVKSREEGDRVEKRHGVERRDKAVRVRARGRERKREVVNGARAWRFHPSRRQQHSRSVVLTQAARHGGANVERLADIGSPTLGEAGVSRAGKRTGCCRFGGRWQGQRPHVFEACAIARFFSSCHEENKERVAVKRTGRERNGEERGEGGREGERGERWRGERRGRERGRHGGRHGEGQRADQRCIRCHLFV